MCSTRPRSHANQLQLAVTWRDGACVLAVAGELDVATEDALFEAVSAALEVSDELTVDLARVSFAGVRGVAALARAAQAAAASGKRLQVQHPPPSVLRILDVMQGSSEWLDTPLSEGEAPPRSVGCR